MNERHPLFIQSGIVMSYVDDYKKLAAIQPYNYRRYAHRFWRWHLMFRDLIER